MSDKVIIVDKPGENLIKAVEKSTNKPVYIVQILDEQNVVKHYKTDKDSFNVYSTHLELRGVCISKTEANKIIKTQNKNLDGEWESLLIPIHRWIQAKSINYKKSK